MKRFLLYLLSICTIGTYAQVTFSGSVINEQGKPLQGASVYLNNTTIGTDSDADGYFRLSVEHGYYDLIVSHVGFETSTYNLNTMKLPDEIVVQMYEKSNLLDEIVINHKNKTGNRAYYLEQFQKNFLGQSFIARKARIKNKHAIKFNYDKVNDILEASATEPLIIENRGLGYKITYDLIHFELQPVGVTYLGHTRYENLEGNTRKKRKWEEEREIAYNGSLRHFLTAAIHQDTLAGFEIDHVKLIPNPKRPSEEQILEAEEFVRKHGGLQRNPYENNSKINKKLQLANDILTKAKKLNRFTEITLRKNIPLKDYFEKENESMFLFSEHSSMRIKYKNEYQEGNYKSPDETFSSKNHQVSRITLYDKKVLVNSMGLFHNPLDVILEGYWGFEKVADWVPLDYKPKNNLHK